MLAEYKAGRRDHLEDMSPMEGEPESSEEEYDLNSSLPYVPRVKISRRRTNALLMISNTIAQLEVEARAAERQERAKRYRLWPHVKAEMARVAAQIREVGAQRKSQETEEIGPGPPGFHYVQVGCVCSLACIYSSNSRAFQGSSLSHSRGWRGSGVHS